jgi:phospho-N-acetylmuramoyl-pentapeptide-transferase
VLYHLFEPLAEDVVGLTLIRFITFRTAYATVTALLIAFVLGPRIIRRLRELQVRESIRDDGPRSHLAKEGTPTMGGLILLGAILLPTLLWADLTNEYVQITLVVTAWLGLIGFMDDYLKAIKHQPKGLVGRKKLAAQVGLGAVLGVWLVWAGPPGFDTATQIPFVKNLILPLGVLFIPWVIIVVTGSSNAVNLTDGLDGLATGLVLICAVGFAALAYLTGRADWSEYLSVQYLEGAGELTVFCGAMVGACLGFLWYNAHPAEVFMGDTGALSLGGALGTLSILLKKELVWFIMGAVFVAEALSVMIQVVYFKRTGRRVFRMAPIHHHFELKGWPESRVVVRFWIIGALVALIALSTLKIR